MRSDTVFRPSMPCRGFTLVELIVVMVITGIVAAMVGTFIRAPVEAYVDTARRARLTEAVDTAVRRFARDIRSALPNSVRVLSAGGSTFIEFIPTVGGGRYRQFSTSGGTGDSLDFSTTDTAFDVIGPVPVYGNGNSVVILNLGAGSSADAYAGNNRAAVSTANVDESLFSSDGTPHSIGFSALRFPAPSPAARFHLVAQPVTYECNPTAGELRRYTGYGYLSAQPAAASSLPASFDILVDRVAPGGCDIFYDPIINNLRTGVVTLRLTLQEQGESVSLVHQVHVQNMP